MTTAFAVETRGLRKAYPDGAVAVDGLDLEVRRGEVLALVGPPGAGKSTVVGMLAGVLRPTAGRAYVAGIDLLARPDAVRSRVALVRPADPAGQRLAIACALLWRPGVLFLDEPTAGLDPPGRAAVHRTLRAMAGEHQTIVLATADLDEAERLADRVVILDRGRVLAMAFPFD